MDSRNIEDENSAFLLEMYHLFNSHLKGLRNIKEQQLVLEKKLNARLSEIEENYNYLVNRLSRIQKKK